MRTSITALAVTVATMFCCTDGAVSAAAASLPKELVPLEFLPASPTRSRPT